MSTTDDAEIDTALRALDELDDAPLSAHVETFEGVYRVLQERLSQAES